jgi:transcriptional regulator with XRE-family HTH domain
MYRHIRDLREDNDLKQWQLARYLRCSQRSYSDYENGRTSIPPRILIELSRLYGTSVDYLLGLTNQKEPHPRCLEEQQKPWKPVLSSVKDQ